MPDRLLIRTQVEGAGEASDQLRRLGRGVKDVGTDAEVADAKFDGFMDTVRGGLRGAVGLVGGFGMALGLKDVVSSGLALQTQQSALQQTLRQTGQAGAGAYSKIMSASEKLSTTGGFATEENLSAINAFEHETGNTAESLKALSAATDLARARHESFDTALGTVRSALAGNYRAVRQLARGFVPVTSSVDALDRSLHVNVASWEQQAESMNKSAAGSGTAWLRQQEIAHGVTDQMRQQAEQQDRLASGQKALALITGQYSGQMAKFSQTAQGRLDATSAAFKNLGANVGESLLPEVKIAAVAMGGFASFLDRNRWAAYALTGVVAILGVEVMGGKLVKGAKDAATAVKTLGGWFDSAAKKVLGLAAGEDVATTSTLATGDAAAAGQLELEGFDAAMADATVETGLFSLALDAIPGVALFTGLTVGLLYVATHFQQVKRLAVDAWHGIETGVKTAAKAIQTAFKAAFDWLKGAFKDVLHFLEHDTPQGGIFSMIKDFAGGHVGAGLGSLVHGATFGLLNQGGPVVATHPSKHLYTGGPAGTDTVEGWLTPGEGVLTRAGMAAIGGEVGLSRINAGFGGQQQIVLQPGQVVTNVQIDGKTVAKAVTHYVLSKGARGPSSLVGGSLVTGV